MSQPNQTYEQRFQAWWDENIGAGPDPDNDPNPTWTHEELKEHCASAFEGGWRWCERPDLKVWQIYRD